MKEADHTDKALKKAVEGLPKFGLPSNFTYRVMQRIGEEARRREARTERRTFILWVVTLTLMIAAGLAYVVYFYGTGLEEDFRTLPTQPVFPSLLVVMPLLMLFNGWLRRKFSQK